MPEHDPEKGFRTFRDGGLDKVDSRTFVQTVDSVSKERSFSLTRMLLVGQFRDEMIISCKVDLSTRRESNSHLKKCRFFKAYAVDHARMAPHPISVLRQSLHRNFARRNLFSLGNVLP